jgi:hypothetical protein
VQWRRYCIESHQSIMGMPWLLARCFWFILGMVHDTVSIIISLRKRFWKKSDAVEKIYFQPCPQQRRNKWPNRPLHSHSLCVLIPI